MTKQQFLDRFFIEYDKVSTLSAPGYTTQELSNLVSEAQESLIIKKYSPQSNRLKEGFEETEKRIEELGDLVVYQTFSTFSAGDFDNSVFITLPNTLLTNPNDYSNVYWFTIYEEATSNQLDCTILNNKTIYVKPDVTEISHDEFKFAQRNPFRKPFIKGSIGRIFRIRSGGRKYHLITDGTFNITNYKLGYIKKPLPIDLLTNTNNSVCQLGDSFHRELLHETVSLAKQYVQDRSLQLDKTNLTE